MNEEIINLILVFLREFGIEVTEKVKEFVEVAYPIAIKQVYVELVSDFIGVLFGGTIILFSLLILVYFYKKRKILVSNKNNLEDEYKKEINSNENECKLQNYKNYSKLDDKLTNINAYILVSILSSVAFFSIFLIPLIRIIQHLLNPNWYAAEMIFEMIKNKGF